MEFQPTHQWGCIFKLIYCTTYKNKTCNTAHYSRNINREQQHKKKNNKWDYSLLSSQLFPPISSSTSEGLVVRNPNDFYLGNIWHQFWQAWTEWGGWVSRSRVTHAWWVELHIALWLPMLQCFPTVISYTQCSIHYVQPRREECALHLGAKPTRSSFRAVCRSTSRRLLRVDVHVLRVSQKADPLLLLPLLCHLRGTERARFVKRRKKKKLFHLLCSAVLIDSVFRSTL